MARFEGFQLISMEGGTTFCPTHTEIIECLHRLITGSELHSGISNITFADVYSAAPYNLVAQHAQPAASSGTGGHGGHEGPYYFLSPVRRVSETSEMKKRAVDGTGGKGHWKREAGKKRVEGTGVGGYMTNFSYREKTASGTTRPGAWVMVEYSIDGCDDVVIAKIKRSTQRKATNVPPSSYMASSSAPVTETLQEIERKLMSDDDYAGVSVDHVESLQAELAKYTCSFPNHDNGNHGELPYAIAGQYNVAGGPAAAHGAPQFFAGQYTPQFFAGPAAAQGAPQFFAGQYNVSGAAPQFFAGPAAAHGAPQFFAGQYNVPGNAAAAHGAPQFFAGPAAAHGAPQFLAGQYNVPGNAAAAAPQFFAGPAAAHGAPQFLAGHYNVSGASQASAAHYLTAALQVSPGHADHANKIVLGHSQTVLDARYEVQGQVAQHLIPEPAIVVGADQVVIPSTSGGLANLDFDDDLYAW